MYKRQVTGSGGFVVSDEKGSVKIKGITTGKIVDYGMEDPMNMGACMAPAAAEVIYQHFVDFNTKPEDYDAIYTGDLGKVGKKILLHLLRENGYDLSGVYGDCGKMCIRDSYSSIQCNAAIWSQDTRSYWSSKGQRMFRRTDL